MIQKRTERHCSDPRLGVKKKEKKKRKRKRKENGFFRNKPEHSEAGTKTLWSLVFSSLVMGAQVLRGSVPWNRISDLWVDMVRLFLLKK